VIRVQAERFDAGAEIVRLQGDNSAIGAIATFIGTVRAVAGDPHATLTLEHYPGMTEAALADIEARARARFEIVDCTVIHRFGTLAAGESIVFVGVTSSHRGEAFRACEFLMDFLKTEAPFWKKESSRSGDHWVESRASDEAKIEDWANPKQGG
jgi:molybdopterin synthase catalytic subunit